MSLHVNSSTTGAWTYPKITPFRLAFILTTGGMGITKAVLVSNGKTAPSTTVEWISGVVVALIFQLLSSCEYNNARPRYLDLLFCYDCFGRSGTSIKEPRPGSGTLESPRRVSSDRAELQPIATGYRLLVSVVFAAFGLVKMLCGYLGFSSAMYTLDWIIAIPLTLGLYYVGLYEEHRPRSWHKFFEADYSSQTVLTFKIAGIALWVTFWSGVLRAALVPKHLYPAPSHGYRMESAVWNAIFEHSLKWTASSFCIGMLEVGALSLGGLLWPRIKAWSGRYARSVRFVGFVAAFVTLYAVVSLICIYTILFLLFVCYRIFALMFYPPPNFDNCFLNCIGLACMMFLVALFAIYPVLSIFYLTEFLRTRGRSLLSED